MGVLASPFGSLPCLFSLLLPTSVWQNRLPCCCSSLQSESRRSSLHVDFSSSCSPCLGSSRATWLTALAFQIFGQIHYYCISGSPYLNSKSPVPMRHCVSSSLLYLCNPCQLLMYPVISLWIYLVSSVWNKRCMRVRDFHRF